MTIDTDVRNTDRDIEREVPIEREKSREVAERDVNESVEKGLNSSLEETRENCDQRLNDIINEDKQNVFLNSDVTVSLFNGSQLGVSIDNNLPITSDTKYEEISSYLGEDKFNSVKEELRDAQKKIDERTKEFNSDKLYTSLVPHFREAEKIKNEDEKLQDAVRDYRGASTNEERQQVLDRNQGKESEIKDWDQKLTKAETAREILISRSSEFTRDVEKNKITYVSPSGRQMEDVREKYASAVADRNVAEKKLEIAERKLSSELKKDNQREIASKCIEKELQKRELNIKNSALTTSRQNPISKGRQEELSKKADELRALGREINKKDFEERGLTNEKEIQYVSNKIEISRLNQEQKDLKSQFCTNSSMKEETAKSLLNNYIRQSKNLEVSKDKVDKIEKREEEKRRFDPKEKEVQDRIKDLSYARNASENISRLNEGRNNIISILDRFPSSRDKEDRDIDKKEKPSIPKVKIRRIVKKEESSLRDEKKDFNNLVGRYEALTPIEKDSFRIYEREFVKTSDDDRGLHGLKEESKENIRNIENELRTQDEHLKDREDFNNAIISGADRAWEDAKREDELIKEARELDQKPKSEDSAVNMGALLEEAKEKTSDKIEELKNTIEKDNNRLEKENNELKIDDDRKEYLNKNLSDLKDNLDKLPKDEQRFVQNGLEIEKNKAEISNLSSLKEEGKVAKIAELKAERIDLKAQIKNAKDANKEISKELKLSKQRQAELNSIAARTTSIDKLADSRLSDKEKTYIENKLLVGDAERSLLKNQVKDNARLEHSREERFNKLTETRTVEEKRDIEKASKELLERQKDFERNKSTSVNKSDERLRSLSGYIDKNSATVTDTVSKMLSKNERNAKELLEKAKLSKEDRAKASTLYEQMRGKEKAQRENVEISKMREKFADIRTQDLRTAEKISESLRERQSELRDLKEKGVKDMSVEQKLYVSNVVNARALSTKLPEMSKAERFEALHKIHEMRSTNEYLKDKMSSEQREKAENALRILDTRDFSKLSKAQDILNMPLNQDKFTPIDTRNTVDIKTKAIDDEIKAIKTVLMKDANEDVKNQLDERIKSLEETKAHIVERGNGPIDESKLEEAKNAISAIPGIKELNLSNEELKYLAMSSPLTNDSKDVIELRDSVQKDFNTTVNSFERLETNSIREYAAVVNTVDVGKITNGLYDKAYDIVYGNERLSDKQVIELKNSVEALNMKANNLYMELNKAERSHTDTICKLTNEDTRYDPKSQQLLNHEISSVLYVDKSPETLQKIEEIRQIRELSDKANQEIFSHLRQDYRPSTEIIRDEKFVEKAVNFSDGRFEPTRAGITAELNNDKFKSFVSNSSLERDTSFKERLDNSSLERNEYDRLLSLHKTYDKALSEFNNELKSGVYGENVLKEMERDLANYRVQLREGLNRQAADGKISVSEIDKTIDRLSNTYMRFQVQTKFFSCINRDELGRPMSYNISLVREDKHGGLNAECHSRAAISQTLGTLSLEESKLGLDITKNNTDLYGSQIDKNIIDKYVDTNGNMLITGNTYLREQASVYNVKDAEKSSYNVMGSIIDEFKNIFGRNAEPQEREELKAANTAVVEDPRSSVSTATLIAQAVIRSLWESSSFGKAYEKSRRDTEEILSKTLGIKNEDKKEEPSVDEVLDEDKRKEEILERAANVARDVEEKEKDSLTEKIDRLSKKSSNFVDRIGEKFGAFGRFAQGIGRGISNAIRSIREERELADIEKGRDKLERFNAKHRDTEKLSFIDRIKYNKLNKELDTKLASRIKSANEAREKYGKEGKWDLAARYERQHFYLVKIFNSRENYINEAKSSTISSKEFISSYSASILSSYTGHNYAANYPMGMPT